MNKNNKNNNSFLQSQQWEEFQEKIGKKTWRVGGVLVIKHNLPFNKNYLYCPRAIISESFFNKIKKIAKQENSIFLKIDPESQLPVTSYQLPVTNSIQPRKTIILDLKKSKEELLKAMHHKTRYNIKLAQKRGVKIKREGDINTFLKLLKKTAKRDDFSLHEPEYYKKLKTAELFLAKYKNQYIAGSLVVFFNKTATYLHGASDYKYRHLMAPYLLQWYAISEAKKRGYKYYDFWGIDEEKWPGVTRFKRGFNGKEIIYPKSVDIVFQSLWHFLYKIVRKLR